MTLNRIDQMIADRDAVLRLALEGDRYALRALEHGDDIALLRRIAKAGLVGARGIAVQRAESRGHARHLIARALGVTTVEVRLLGHPVGAA